LPPKSGLHLISGNISLKFTGTAWLCSILFMHYFFLAAAASTSASESSNELENPRIILSCFASYLQTDTSLIACITKLLYAVINPTIFGSFCSNPGLN